MSDLNGRTALVTGGARGVGRCIANMLAEQGACVAIGDVLFDHARAASAELQRDGHTAMAVDMNVSSRQSAFKAVDEVVEKWGSIDILINNAGVAPSPTFTPEKDDVDEVWRHVLEVNLLGMVHATDAAAIHMSEARYGKIVNIASTAGKPGDPPPQRQKENPRYVHPPMGAYSASKAAVIRYTQILAVSLGPFNVNVNAVCPSRMVTEMGLQIAARQTGKDLDEAREELAEVRRAAIKAGNRLGRELVPEDVAHATAFLCSEAANNITGQSLNVDGGFKMT